MSLARFWSRLSFRSLFKSRAQRTRRRQFLSLASFMPSLQASWATRETGNWLRPRVEGLEPRHLLAPVIQAALTDAPPGGVAPGDTIYYTEVVSNATGAMDATNVQVENMLDSHTTLVPGSLNISPLAFDESFNTIGNTQLFVNATGTNPGTT